MSDKFVVVCDPESVFVTGDGLIDSPLGAYVVDPSAEGTDRFWLCFQGKNGYQRFQHSSRAKQAISP